MISHIGMDIPKKVKQNTVNSLAWILHLGVLNSKGYTVYVG